MFFVYLLGIGCMAQDCVVLAPEDFVLSIVNRPTLREKYQRFAFRDYVKSHPQLRYNKKFSVVAFQRCISLEINVNGFSVADFVLDQIVIS